MSLLEIGVSGLRSYQRALDATGSNIANANTPGYSRQRTEFTAREGGAGVDASAVRRITSGLLTTQLRDDLSAATGSDVLRTQLSQLDGVLSGNGTSLGEVLDRFSNDLQAAALDPESESTRALVLESAQAVADRFGALQRRIDQARLAVNGEIAGRLEKVNDLIDAISQLNASTDALDQDNDLLDRRDHLLEQLSEELAISVTEVDSQVQVLTRAGQPLVLPGVPAGTYRLAITDAQRGTVGISGPGATIDVTRSLGAGALGALVEFRDGSLAHVDDELGRLAAGLAQAANTQQALGVTADGNLGQPLFGFGRLAGTPENFVTYIGSGNAPLPDLSIEDAAALRASAYRVTFDGQSASRFQVQRLADGAIVADATLTGTYPQSLSFDGLELTLTGPGYQPLDRLELAPLRGLAGLIERHIDSPSELALAGAVTGIADAANRGEGRVQSAAALQSAVAADLRDGVLPPLMVRFTSANEYDILDASDPFAPVPLDPPLRGLEFVANRPNEMFVAEGTLGTLSDGPAIGAVTAAQTSTGPGVLGNGYPAENIRFDQRDGDGVLLRADTVSIAAGASAREIAASLSEVTGVEADARTTATLSNLVDDGVGEPLALFVAGQRIAAGGPTPLTASEVVRQVNDNPALTDAGIRARLVGGDAQIIDTTGADLQIALAGDASDSVLVSGSNSVTLAGQGAGMVSGVAVGGDVALRLAPGTRLRADPGSSFFASVPRPVVSGLSLVISGEPLAGDRFTVDLNATPVGDNRNALALAAVATGPVLADSESLGEAYQRLSGGIAARSAEAGITAESNASIAASSRSALASVAGVNLDEEAANMLRYEQNYNASARVISIARSLFDALLGIFN